MKIIYVNVGSGNCTIAKTDSGKVIMIDCGDIERRQEAVYNDILEPKGDGRLQTNANSDYAKVNIAEAMELLGVGLGDKIDYFIASHADGDHVGNAYIDDFNGVLADYEIGEYIQPSGELECLKLYSEKYKGTNVGRRLDSVINEYEKRLNFLARKGVPVKSYGNGEVIKLDNGDYIKFFNDKKTPQYHNENYNYDYWYSDDVKRSNISGATPDNIVKVDNQLFCNKYDRVPADKKSIYLHKVNIKDMVNSKGEPYVLGTIRNAYSMVVQLCINGYKHMITGDANVKELDDIAKKYPGKLRSHICTAAHHGTQQSASIAFMQEVKPYKWINQINVYRQKAVRDGADYITRYYESITSSAPGWYNVCDCWRYQQEEIGLIFTDENPFFIPELDKVDRSYLQYLHNTARALPKGLFSKASISTVANARKLDTRTDDELVHDSEKELEQALNHLKVEVESKEEFNEQKQ